MSKKDKTRIGSLAALALIASLIAGGATTGKSILDRLNDSYQNRLRWRIHEVYRSCSTLNRLPENRDLAFIIEEDLPDLATKLYLVDGNWRDAARSAEYGQDFDLASRLYEKGGDLLHAAKVAKKAGHFLRASILYERLYGGIEGLGGMYFGYNAAEAAEKAGHFLRASILYERIASSIHEKYTEVENPGTTGLWNSRNLQYEEDVALSNSARTAAEGRDFDRAINLAERKLAIANKALIGPFIQDPDAYFQSEKSWIIGKQFAESLLAEYRQAVKDQ